MLGHVDDGFVVGAVGRAELRMPVYIINLQRDVARRQKLLDQFAALPDFDPRIVVAVYGPGLSDTIAEVLISNPDRPDWVGYKGTLGCHLSHVMAWERIAALDVPAIVIEDDVNVSRLEALWEMTIPVNAELVFLNDRMAPPRESSEVLPIWHALVLLDAKDRGLGGTDGYILTPGAARKLVAASRNDLFFGHVDGRLLRYAVSEDDLAYLSADSWIVNVVRNHHNRHRLPELGLLRGYCVTPALVMHVGDHSVRNELDDKRTQ